MKMEKAMKQERNVTNGEYREIVEEEFLRYTTKNPFVLQYFYKDLCTFLS